ncbi:MAG: acetyl-CoA C-acyltransferase [Actinobacteria bacterium]|nr:acetyl-CoA C-acyltransferase [Actinomycetota bacterium]
MAVDYGDVYLIDGLRTPIGRFGGALATVRADDLAAHAIRAAVDRAALPEDEIADVYFGSSNQAGEDNRDVARMAALLAGLPVSVPGATVNRLCASGMEAVADAARCVAAGDADLYLAGGVESMTRAPFVYGKQGTAWSREPATVYDTTIGWRFVNPAFPHSTEGMGETGENVAERFSISREDQDAFAAASHQRAAAAWEAGLFDDEVVPVIAPPQRRKDDPVTVTRDEGIRPDTTAESLARLKPAFREDGSVTAGNSSQISDGAACLVIGSATRAKSLGREPLARIVAAASAGVDPAVMGIGPIDAVARLLERTGLSTADVDLWEINEAFASQALASARAIGIEHAQLNVNGGGIALGHPLGCTGARITATLAYEMRRRGVKRGIATLCVGVGQGLALMLENPAVA